jgi:DMSO/TMAO reductase YedYZ molybdopterin-dependent catalytic subunit
MNQLKRIVSPDTLRENRLPPGQRLIEKWPVEPAGNVHYIQTAQWTFKITGLVEKECTLTYEEFAALPRVEVFSDIHCVTTWSRLDNLWEGVSAAVIKDLVTIKPAAKYVMVAGEKDFTTNLPLDDFFQEDVVFAFKHDGEALSAGHGGPVRLVVPRLYFWKSAKWVTGLNFVAENAPGYWERAGYHMHGDPWIEERYGGH